MLQTDRQKHGPRHKRCINRPRLYAVHIRCCVIIWYARVVSCQRSSGGAAVVGKSASNPTSPVVQPRRAVSSPEELAVQDAIDAGFVVDGAGGGGGGLLDADGGHYSTVSAIATAPRIHRQAQRTTPHVPVSYTHLTLPTKRIV